jgi:hypothetical protein
MTAAYRDLDPVLQARLTKFRERQERERGAIDAARRVLAIRVGLAWAGGTVTAFGVLMFLVALGPWKGEAALLMGGGWVAGAVAMVIGRARVLSREAAALAAEPVLTGDTHADLAHLDGIDLPTAMRERARRWEWASTACSLVGLSLLSPLTLHWAVGTFIAACHGGESGGGFGEWVALSAGFVGLAHIALVVCTLVWSRALLRRPTGLLQAGVHRAWMKALGAAIAASLVPGVFFIKDVGLLALMPALLVAATGVAFVPLMYWVTARRLTSERSRLGD